MKAYVTSIGEQTVDLCVWSLARNGFTVELLDNPGRTLAQKLKWIYEHAGDDFIRIDADVVVNNQFTPAFLTWLQLRDPNIWWWQFLVFDWFKLNKTHSASYIKAAAIPALRANIDRFERHNRPETEMSRIKEFYEPRRFETYNDGIIGLHGYKGNIERAKRLKHIRNQQDLYDFEMAERLNSL
jgi:hypothetical protein